ncbi:MAG: extracellular solute-binding protein [Phycisphaerae bacterium]|nr:extracellular solute-binding protein [Phycisphaerae bacterium]
MHLRRLTIVSLSTSFALFGLACERNREHSGNSSAKASGEVVVYTSVDEQFARDVLREFEARTGVTVRMIGDAEAGKTTGLVNRILAEAKSGRPRADVFWSGEIFNTIRLAQEGVLEPYGSPDADDIPARFRDPANHWTAMAVRARVIAFDPRRTPREAVPAHWEQVAAPDFASRTAIANPLFGTTSGHVAAMFVLWGDERALAFLESLAENGAAIEAGNSAAVRAVMDGRVDFACTDTDDVWVAQKAGASVDLVYPDMGGGGTLLVPCTVALVRGAPHPAPGRDLVDYLVSAEVERMLAESPSRNIPVRAALREELGLTWPPETEVDYQAVADEMEKAMNIVRNVLLR